MAASQETVLAELARANALMKKGDEYSAAVALGGVLSTLKGAPHPRPEQWTQAVSSLAGRVEGTGRIAQRASERLARIERILSVGGCLSVEEWLLVLTLRIEVSMVALFFLEEVKQSLELNTADIDHQVKRRRNAAGDKESFASASKLVRENWFSLLPCDLSKLGIEGLLK